MNYLPSKLTLKFIDDIGNKVSLSLKKISAVSEGDKHVILFIDNGGKIIIYEEGYTVPAGDDSISTGKITAEYMAEIKTHLNVLF